MDKAIAERQKPDYVPWIVFEGEMARNERTVRRLWVALIVAIALIFATVGVFVWYLEQYDYTSSETITIDGADGIANYIGKDGTIYNGENHGEAYPISNEEGRQQQRNP